MMKTEMAALNNGSITRYSRNAEKGGTSSSDLTITSLTRSRRYEWRSLEDLSSDHVPRLVTSNGGPPRRKKPSRKEGHPQPRQSKLDHVRPDLGRRNGQGVEGEHSIPAKYRKLVTLLQDASERRTPIKVIRRADEIDK